MFSYRRGVSEIEEDDTRGDRVERSLRHHRERLDELAAALTPAVVRRVRRYAHHRARVLALLGPAPRGARLDALVAEVIAAAAGAPAAWDQARCDLASHLCAAVRAALQPRGRGAPTPADPGQPGAEVDGANTAERVRVAVRVMAALYDATVTRNHGEVVGLLDGFRRGAEARADVATQLGIRVRPPARAGARTGAARGGARRVAAPAARVGG